MDASPKEISVSIRNVASALWFPVVLVSVLNFPMILFGVGFLFDTVSYTDMLQSGFKFDVPGTLDKYFFFALWFGVMTVVNSVIAIHWIVRRLKLHV